ncbi:cell surface glycoprotein 1-like [Penaeus chinensis]|uniref:cell surface glycoprotein 1-like n=1 Tax=Penaeus chinensis TaxID=139456 RepID=UPI001FB7DF6A|nr:cell surface glycoprotein 1-like [Penaeus chinensis]
MFRRYIQINNESREQLLVKILVFEHGRGSYYVQLPDGSLQVTHHVDGDSGIVAEVTYEGHAQYQAHQPSYHPTPAYQPTPSYHTTPSYHPTPAYRPTPSYRPRPHH